MWISLRQLSLIDSRQVKDSLGKYKEVSETFVKLDCGTALAGDSSLSWADDVSGPGVHDQSRAHHQRHDPTILDLSLIHI